MPYFELYIMYKLKIVKGYNHISVKCQYIESDKNKTIKIFTKSL